MSALAPILQAYFSQRLAQRGASPHTVASYRDTFCLLLRFVQQRLGKPPSALDVADVDATMVGQFLDHLQSERGNCASTRNNRLAAIHALFGYAALRCPEHAATIGRVLAIPPRRIDNTLVTFLTQDEVEALLASPDRTTRLGRRDHLLLLVATQTGLRVGELTGLTRGDVTLGAGANLRCTGKGRKQRCTPLTRPTAHIMGDWLTEHRGSEPSDPLFTNRGGGRLSRDAVADLLAKHVATAASRCPSLNAKHVTPHTLRHTAMSLLGAGVDTSTIALWLGHAGTKATQIYLHADLALKEQALARTAPPTVGRNRYTPPDAVLTWLECL